MFLIIIMKMDTKFKFTIYFIVNKYIIIIYMKMYLPKKYIIINYLSTCKNFMNLLN